MTFSMVQVREPMKQVAGMMLSSVLGESDTVNWHERALGLRFLVPGL